MITINIGQIQKIEMEMLREACEILGKNDIPFFMGFGSVLGAIRHQGPIPWDTDTDILIPFPLLEKAKKCLEEGLTSRFCVDDLDRNGKYKNFFPRVAMPHTSSDTLHIDLFPLIGVSEDLTEQKKMFAEFEKRNRVFVRLKHFRSNIVHPTFLKKAVGRFIELFCSPYSKKALCKQYHKILSKWDYNTATHVASGCGEYGEKNIFEKTVFGTPIMVPYGDLSVPIPEQWDFYLRRFYKDYMQFPPEEVRNFWLNFKLSIDDRDYAAIEDILADEQK